MIRLHHLNFSRSTRVLWLLEEMGVAYDLVQHSRDSTTFRSPPSLAAVHPLAKAPTVEVDGKVMMESGAILEYLVERFGEGRFGAAPGSDDRAAYLEWLHFAEGTLGMSAILMMLAGRLQLSDAAKGFMGAELVKLLDHADATLEGRDFLVGSDLTAADINLEYLIELCEAMGQLQTRPHLARWLAGLKARPAYQKAIELGGPIVPPFGG